MTESLDQWIDREYRYAATALLRGVSRLDLVKQRPGFGQSIRAARGAIVGSPVLASYDPDPDYFYHWFRDSALVIDALHRLHQDRTLGDEALAHVADFVRFSTALNRLDGRALVDEPAWRAKVAPDFVRFLRDDAELAQVRGAAVAAEARVNADGTLDISKWNRPQNDGPPLRALALLRWLRGASPDAAFENEAAALVRSDLAFTFDNALRPSYDIWEEERGLHYYVLRISAAALQEGSTWLELRGEREQLVRAYRTHAATIFRKLDDFWLPKEGHCRSRILNSGARSAKELDVSVVLAAIHSGSRGPVHSAHDPRLQATLARLEAVFDAAYPINRNRPPQRGPALGRYGGDVYYGGGAWYLATLGAAEFCFRAAQGAEQARAWRARGDAYLATVRAYAPDSGELSEQFDALSGAQKSARDLPWSYAAFITCIAARRALAQEQPR